MDNEHRLIEDIGVGLGTAGINGKEVPVIMLEVPGSIESDVILSLTAAKSLFVDLRKLITACEEFQATGAFPDMDATDVEGDE